MNVDTIVISQEQAEHKLRAYQTLRAKQRTQEDELLMSVYKQVQKGGRVLNLVEAFKQTGLDEQGQPKLAIARADWSEVNFFTREKCIFSCNRFWKPHATRQFITLPADTFARSKLTLRTLHSAVPHVPPDVRPPFALSNYWILFEVEAWQSYPVDPYLLKRISGMLFVVMAEWNLTPLEAMLLSSMETP